VAPPRLRRGVRPASRRIVTALAVGLLASLTACAGDGSGADLSAPGPSASAESPPASADATPPAAAPAPPARVRIPRLGLAEDLVDLGIAATGELEVPADPARVGWFAGGGRPGGPGPTVLVGHLDSATGPAVFARVPDLVPGDEIRVRSADGGRVVYVVTRVADFPQQGFPTEAVFGSTPTDSLRLITCTGPYDRAAGRYTENRVVYAEPHSVP